MIIFPNTRISFYLQRTLECIGFSVEVYTDALSGVRSDVGVMETLLVLTHPYRQIDSSIQYSGTKNEILSDYYY